MLAQDACTTKTCTLVGCFDGVSTRFALEEPVSTLAGGSVAACRDDTCLEASLESSLPDPFAPPMGRLLRRAEAA